MAKSNQRKRRREQYPALQSEKLQCLGYSTKQINDLMDCKSHAAGVPKLIELHSTFMDISCPINKEQKITHQDLVDMLVKGRSSLVFEAFLKYYNRLFLKGYSLEQILKASRKPGSRLTLEAMVEVTDKLIKMGFSLEDIRIIAHHSGASGVLYELEANANILLGCGYPVRTIKKIASSFIGARGINEELNVCRKLFAYGFTADDIKLFHYETPDFDEKKIHGVLALIEPMPAQGYSQEDIKSIVLSMVEKQKRYIIEKKSAIVDNYTRVLDELNIDCEYITSQVNCRSSKFLSRVVIHVTELSKLGFKNESIALILMQKQENILRYLALVREQTEEMIKFGRNIDFIEPIVTVYGVEVLQNWPKLSLKWPRLYQPWSELLTFGMYSKEIVEIALREDGVKSMKFILKHAEQYLERNIGLREIQNYAAEGGLGSLEQLLNRQKQFKNIQEQSVNRRLSFWGDGHRPTGEQENNNESDDTLVP